ncbi:MAG: LAGLIDADG family homing endonuclease, partial [Candidatus Komeilibacteria bacterium]
FMIRSIKFGFQETGKLAQKFKLLAREIGIPIICIAHVTKPQLLADGTPKRASGADIRDCVPGDQIVYGSGKRVFVKDIKVGMSVVSLGRSNRLQNDIVQDVWETGEKEIYRLTTKTGRVIKCSDGHRFFAATYKKGTGMVLGENKYGTGLQGWTELKDLEIGQKIAIVKNYPDVETATLSLDKACLLGWIIGDGSISPQGYAEITTGIIEEANFIKQIADKEFNLDCKIRKYKDKNAFRIYLVGNNTKNELARWLRSLKFYPVGVNKYVPNIIFEQPKEIIGAFLSGLFQADGTIKNNQGNKDWIISPLIKLSTFSKRLAYDVQHLLIRLGIVSYVRSYDAKRSGFRTKNKLGWEVAFSGSNILLFKKYSSLYFRKQDKLVALTRNWKPKDRERKMDIFFDRIKSIEYVGKQKTYDVQVVGHHSSLENHSLCINDILTHNSGLLYGDADYIFLIHRKPIPTVGGTWDGEFEDDVEIVVFKSRHSAKGKIKGLTFFGSIGRIE